MRFVSIIFYLLSLLLYYSYTNIKFTPSICGISGSIGHKYFIQKSKRIQINGRWKGCQLMVSMRHAIIYPPVILSLEMSQRVLFFLRL